MTFSPNPYEIRTDEDGFGQIMICRGNWLSGNIREFETGSVQGLSLADVWWSEDNVEFLTDLPAHSVHVIGINSYKVTDVSSLSKFEQLRKINLSVKDAVGFRSSDFPHLEVLGYTYCQSGIIDSLPTELRVLMLDRYPGKTLEALPAVEGLDRLQVGSRILTSLEGLERFPNLTDLTVLDARNLSDIGAIAKFPKLRKLCLSGAVKIDDIAPIAQLSELRFLELENLKDIASVKALHTLRNLEQLQITGSSTILDKDLSPIESLPKLKRLVLEPRRGYVPKTADILAKVNIRH